MSDNSGMSESITKRREGWLNFDRVRPVQSPIMSVCFRCNRQSQACTIHRTAKVQFVSSSDSVSTTCSHKYSPQHSLAFRSRLACDANVGFFAMSDPPSTQRERKAEWRRSTQAEMEASGGGHQRSLAWSEEAGVGVLMSAEWIAEEGAMDEERVMEWHEQACQCFCFSTASSASCCVVWTTTRTIRAMFSHVTSASWRAGEDVWRAKIQR
ncbi:hypothetical protein BLNAU_16330 [Blattamonas nauphoetae]|uniref:Uncharacterized protein n=1 Tax=Blattamonas nauphoetae TaxID=2049346 RepID=A0ABQ9XBN3_9EUKA|nr:hypothetical protein BLNAU_16330 [Blattamonas nauphoetae]